MEQSFELDMLQSHDCHLLGVPFLHFPISTISKLKHFPGSNFSVSSSNFLNSYRHLSERQLKKQSTAHM